VQAIVQRAIAYDPDARFATALDLNRALERAMTELGEPTSIAVVEGYTMQLLAERKAARRRSVEDALARADGRGHERTPGTGGGGPNQARGGGGGHATPRMTRAASASAGSLPGMAAAPPPGAHFSAPAGPGSAAHPMSLAEVPSAPTTTSTSGAAAAIDHVARSGGDLLDPATRRRRMRNALGVGLALSAAVIGGAVAVRSTTGLGKARGTAAASDATQAAHVAPPSVPSPRDPSEQARAPSTTAQQEPVAPKAAAAVTAADTASPARDVMVEDAALQRDAPTDAGAILDTVDTVDASAPKQTPRK
jgi:hypothetical protein